MFSTVSRRYYVLNIFKSTGIVIYTRGIQQRKAQGGGGAMDDCAVNKSVILVSEHLVELPLTSRWVAAVMMKCREQNSEADDGRRLRCLGGDGVS